MPAFSYIYALLPVQILLKYNRESNTERTSWWFVNFSRHGTHKIIYLSDVVYQRPVKRNLRSYLSWQPLSSSRKLRSHQLYFKYILLFKVTNLSLSNSYNPKIVFPSTTKFLGFFWIKLFTLIYGDSEVLSLWGLNIYRTINMYSYIRMRQNKKKHWQNEDQ